MLELRHVSKAYRGPRGSVTALADLSLQVHAGEFVAVQGPSGSGKTTLLLAAGGMLQPDQGQVMVHGEDIYRLSSEARARFRATRLGFVFQQFHLVPYLSVLENVLAPALAHAAPHLRERAAELCNQVGLGHRLHHRPSELSSGERQRCALARALLHRPPLLLADEPTGNLDEANANMILDHLQEYVRQGNALLLVTHDPRAAARASRAVQLRTAIA
jgi:ABC-type lipoprotein export system ATPase subunit